MLDARSLDLEASQVMASVARTFDLAARLLPTEVRRDVRRLYLVMRTLDDLVDRGHPGAAARVTAVEHWAAGPTVGPAAGSASASPELDILDDLVSRHPALPRDAIADFAAGMRTDLAGPAIATDLDLDRYCDQVAGTVGRLMAVLLGTTVRAGTDPAARTALAAETDAAARALGRAMQRTNVLRDIVEDAAAGRVYLPADALAQVGVTTGDAATALQSLRAWPIERRRALLAPQIARADADYEVGLAGVTHLRAGRRAVAAAGSMYRGILREIERDGFGASGRRVAVPRHRKAVAIIGTLRPGHIG